MWKEQHGIRFSHDLQTADMAEILFPSFSLRESPSYSQRQFIMIWIPLLFSRHSRRRNKRSGRIKRKLEKNIYIKIEKPEIEDRILRTLASVKVLQRSARNDRKRLPEHRVPETNRFSELSKIENKFSEIENRVLGTIKDREQILGTIKDREQIRGTIKNRKQSSRNYQR